ncbi:MAG: DUF3078 domain-containing protein [Bacteroidales bacterium]|nr:DUF3078 domain-containing protein [Bacteroidales bacterium]
MRENLLGLSLSFILLTISIPGFSQDPGKSGRLSAALVDSLGKSGLVVELSNKNPEVILSREQAIRFLQQKLRPRVWKDIDDPLRRALDHLVYEVSRPPFDSSAAFLERYPYDSISIPWDKFYIWEPVRLKIPAVTPQQQQPVADTSVAADSRRLKAVSDTIMKTRLDISGFPPSAPSASKLKDTTLLVIIDTLNEVRSDYSRFPFTHYSFPYQSDSIKAAVTALLGYLGERDSTVINFTGIDNVEIPVWINSKSDRMMRYWLKNELNDSVTVWIGSTARNTIGLFLEHGVNFRRPVKQQNYTNARIDIEKVDKSTLLDAREITIKPQYWRYRSEAAFALNQASMNNWVKGGESSVSTTFDITGYADYTNKDMKLSSNHFARLKFGLIALFGSGKPDFRKNLDLLETNSKLNHKAFGKFDVSGILLFKTQIAKGYAYSATDTTLVSKFLNPAILTMGLGLDYKPNKTTSINFSPFSYKGTFVHDTASIDQTKYGIEKGRRSKNEPGASFMISNSFKPYKTVSVTNRLQLFTNYIHNPLNIDVDWEMIVTTSLNWFTDVRFNTHLIFDDDTKTPVLDKDRKPIMDSEEKPKKAARIQFKELLGFSFIFRF